jgi:hypothetical protein
MGCRDTEYPNNVFNPYQIQYQIVQLINTAKGQLTASFVVCSLYMPNRTQAKP